MIRKWRSADSKGETSRRGGLLQEESSARQTQTRERQTHVVVCDLFSLVVVRVLALSDLGRAACASHSDGVSSRLDTQRAPVELNFLSAAQRKISSWRTRFEKTEEP